MSLTKDAILEADDLPREKLHIPEWGGDVWVRRMTGAQRDWFEASMGGGEGGPNLKNLRARLAALTLVDEAGQPIFTLDDVGRLGDKSSVALDRVFGLAQRMNALTPDEIEELAKNSETAPDGDSVSD